MTDQPTGDPTHGLSVQHADALWDAVAIPGPTEPTFPMQHERVCRAVADILYELTPASPAVPVSSPPPDQTAVERSERYATAIHDAMEPDLSLVDQEPGCQALFARAAEAAMALADAERAAVCICEHTEQQHFEDACLVCDCGDYLPPAAAREVIARYQAAVKREPADQAALRERIAMTLARTKLRPPYLHCLVMADAVLAELPPPADRTTVLLWAADQIDAETRQAKADGVLEPEKFRPCRDASAQLRALAGCQECASGLEHNTHCPTPETHNWGCGCPSDVAAAIASCPGYEPEGPSPCRCPCYGCKHHCGAHDPSRLAAEAQQPDTETQAHPPIHAWRVETRDPIADQWAPGSHFAHRPNAVERWETANRTAPLWKDGTPVERRIVRETTTFTVEEATPAHIGGVADDCPACQAQGLHTIGHPYECPGPETTAGGDRTD